MMPPKTRASKRLKENKKLHAKALPDIILAVEEYLDDHSRWESSSDEGSELGISDELGPEQLKLSSKPPMGGMQMLEELRPPHSVCSEIPVLRGLAEDIAAIPNSRCADFNSSLEDAIQEVSLVKEDFNPTCGVTVDISATEFATMYYRLDQLRQAACKDIERDAQSVTREIQAWADRPVTLDEKENHEDTVAKTGAIEYANNMSSHRWERAWTIHDNDWDVVQWACKYDRTKTHILAVSLDDMGHAYTILVNPFAILHFTNSVPLWIWNAEKIVECLPKQHPWRSFLKQTETYTKLKIM